MLKNYTQAISSEDATALDKDLIDTGGFSLDQLMELAGLSVSQAGTVLQSSQNRFWLVGFKWFNLQDQTTDTKADSDLNSVSHPSLKCGKEHLSRLWPRE